MFFRVAEARQAAREFESAQYVRKSAGTLLTDSVQFSEAKKFDVFLSHSFDDAEIILGVKRLIEKRGKSVYVDWIEDKGLDRGKVTPATAALLRNRMRSCSTFIYASSESSPSSRWMPWELGYFDGHKPDMISIMPLVENYDFEWKSQEYLGLYPVLERPNNSSADSTAYVVRGSRIQKLADFGNALPTDSYKTW
ncbi:MAG TPA: hypothetical protein VGN01_09420 [Acidobacteriaceae bacterium]